DAVLKNHGVIFGEFAGDGMTTVHPATTPGTVVRRLLARPNTIADYEFVRWQPGPIPGGFGNLQEFFQFMTLARTGT
ncbi:MAG: hypothetical protein EA361_02895, partial [Bacteroidetes bacterium]